MFDNIVKNNKCIYCLGQVLSYSFVYGAIGYFNNHAYTPLSHFPVEGEWMTVTHISACLVAFDVIDRFARYVLEKINSRIACNPFVQIGRVFFSLTLTSRILLGFLATPIAIVEITMVTNFIALTCLFGCVKIWQKMTHGINFSTKERIVIDVNGGDVKFIPLRDFKSSKQG